VRVKRSEFGAGRGVFAERSFSAGETVCFFHGRRVAAARLDSLPSEVRAKYFAYMMSGPDPTLLCVPLLPGGDVPKDLPADFAGCLINEASFVDGQHRKPNVCVVLPPSALKGAKLGCPVFGPDVVVYDWPCVATREIRRKEELLLCYGEDYGPRKGYRLSGYCPGC
jgi:hypothetical protein